MIIRISVFIFLLCSAAFSEEAILKTDLNEYRLSYNYHSAMRIIPHGIIDQVRGIKINDGVVSKENDGA